MAVHRLSEIMKKRKAFTFLEVMFGLSIIGVISAMVIPIFYNSYADRIRGTQLKKVCAQISLAIDSIMSDERGNDEDTDFVKEQSELATQNSTQSSNNDEEDENTETESTENSQTENTQTTDETNADEEATVVSQGFYLTSAGVKTSNATQGAEYFLNKYFKHTKVNCGSGGSNDCIGRSYRSPEKKVLGTIPESYYCIRTVNSAAICMKYDETYHVTRVIVDINAADKPNITGSDTFVMYITADGQLKDIDDDESNCNKNRTEGVTVENFAAGCFTKIVSNGWKMAK